MRVGTKTGLEEIAESNKTPGRRVDDIWGK